MKSRPAFTLMELLVYLGISTIVIFVLSKFMVDVSHNAARNRASLEVQSNARLIMSRITQNIRTASSLTPPAGAALSLTASGNDYVYTFDSANQEVTESINGGTATTINSDKVLISNLTFTSQTGGVQIDLTVDSTTSGSPAVPSQRLLTTAIPRQALY